MHHFGFLRQPWLDSVHFAGTALATSWCGYMSGAVQSGYRAAAEIIKEVDPSKLTQEDKVRPINFSSLNSNTIARNFNLLDFENIPLYTG